MSSLKAAYDCKQREVNSAMEMKGRAARALAPPVAASRQRQAGHNGNQPARRQR